MTGTDSDAREGKKVEIFASLRQHGVYIEHKFHAARQYDIAAEDIKAILSDITELVTDYPEEESATTIAIKNLCASAISLYYDPQTRPYFFDQVQRIGSLLKQV